MQISIYKRVLSQKEWLTRRPSYSPLLKCQDRRLQP